MVVIAILVGGDRLDLVEYWSLVIGVNETERKVLVEIWLEPGNNVFILLFIFDIAGKLEVHAPVVPRVVAFYMGHVFWGLEFPRLLLDTDEHTSQLLVINKLQVANRVLFPIVVLG